MARGRGRAANFARLAIVSAGFAVYALGIATTARRVFSGGAFLLRASQARDSEAEDDDEPHGCNVSQWSFAI